MPSSMSLRARMHAVSERTRRLRTASISDLDAAIGAIAKGNLSIPVTATTELVRNFELATPDGGREAGGQPQSRAAIGRGRPLSRARAATAECV